MPSFLRLLGNLLVDERRSHKPRADDVRAHAVLGAFLGHHLGKADEAVLCGDVGSFQQRGFLGVDRAHVDDAAAPALLVHLPQGRPVVRNAPSR